MNQPPADIRFHPDENLRDHNFLSWHCGVLWRPSRPSYRPQLLGRLNQAREQRESSRNPRAVLGTTISGNFAPLAGDRTIALAHRSSDVLKIGKGVFEHRVYEHLRPCLPAGLL